MGHLYTMEIGVRGKYTLTIQHLLTFFKQKGKTAGNFLFILQVQNISEAESKIYLKRLKQKAIPMLKVKFRAWQFYSNYW